MFDSSQDFPSPTFCKVKLNFTGQPAVIQACASPSISANDLKLTVNWVPNKPYLFFHGPNQTEVPFGHGWLCMTNDIVRLGPAQIATGNVASYTMNVPQEIATPGTRNFKCWFRTGMGWGPTFNISNAISITFVP